MGIGLGIAYLMYQLTAGEDGPETVRVIRDERRFSVSVVSVSVI